MLELELDKVHAFQRSKTTELARRIAQAEQDVHKLVRQEEAYHASLAALANAEGANGTIGAGQRDAQTGGGGHTRGLTRAKTYPAAAVDLEQQQHTVHAEDGGSEDDADDADSDDDALGDESSSKSADTFEEQFRWLEEEVATLVADVHDLALYSKLNLTGFMKILKVRYVVHGASFAFEICSFMGFLRNTT